jgi:anthranilate phosphoribosyltransferase
MKQILQALFEHQTLSRAEARNILVEISEGKHNESHVASFLTVYSIRSITPEELLGFVDAMQQLCIKADLGTSDTVDLCGTGGDGKNTFNISTLASFVTAGAGIPVAKHGNYGVSSGCGSSNVLEAMGYVFTSDQSKLRRSLDKAGICFLHAPLFHPAMKFVAPIRRALGFKTFFNMVGPLSNPSFPKAQSTGVFSLELARLYKYVLQETGKNFSIIHSTCGYDEISLTGNFRLITNTEDLLLSPADWGMPKLSAADISGGSTVEEASALFAKILAGGGSPAQKAAVTCNAASAIRTARPQLSVADSIAMAQESLDSGKAAASLKTLLDL